MIVVQAVVPCVLGSARSKFNAKYRIYILGKGCKIGLREQRVEYCKRN